MLKRTLMFMHPATLSMKNAQLVINRREAFEGIKAEGIEEGWKEGRKEGIKEGRKAELKDKYKSWVTLSNNLKKRGMSNPEIASLLGVPETELQKAFKMIKEEKTEKMNMK